MDPLDADAPNPLLAPVRQLIDAARQRVASAVNAELTQLYWHIGRRISAELLQGQRGEYGKQVVAELARQLTAEFGKGWSEQQLRHCLRLVEVFADEQILSTVQRELSWSHLKALIYMEELLQLPQSNIRVADYLTLLPPRATLQAKLHQSIAIARQKLVRDTGPSNTVCGATRRPTRTGEKYVKNTSSLFSTYASSY